MNVIKHEATGFSIREERAQQDIDVINEVFVADTYAIRQLSRILGQGGSILDVGGHIGSFSALAIRLMRPKKIVAVEPFSENHELLTRNLRHFAIEADCPYQSAVHACVRYDGAAIYVAGAGATGGGLMVKPDEVDRWTANRDRSRGEVYTVAEENVPSVTIEQVMSDHLMPQVDLLKIDCEGSERDIFRQISDEAAMGIRAIVGEYHWGPQDIRESMPPKFPHLEVRFIEGNHHLGTFWALPPSTWFTFEQVHPASARLQRL